MFAIRSLLSLTVAGFLTLWASLPISLSPPAEGPQKPDQAEATRPVDEGPAQGVIVHSEPLNQKDQPKPQTPIDESPDLPGYANFCRVIATPEEVILDFAVNPQPFGSGEQHVKPGQRIVVNFYTAKRLKIALEKTIQRHEQTFGTIELDVRRRAKSAREREQWPDMKK